MKLMDILVPDAVILDLESNSKDAVLGEMSRSLASAVAGIDSGHLLKVLTEREGLQSTAIGEGVAIPHGKLSGLDVLVAGFARSRAGIDFDSIDGNVTQLFFLLVVPEHSGGQHLKALARISRFLRDPGFRERLIGAPDLESVIDVIAQEDAKF